MTKYKEALIFKNDPYNHEIIKGNILINARKRLNMQNKQINDIQIKTSKHKNGIFIDLSNDVYCPGCENPRLIVQSDGIKTNDQDKNHEEWCEYKYEHASQKFLNEWSKNPKNQEIIKRKLNKIVATLNNAQSKKNQNNNNNYLNTKRNINNSLMLKSNDGKKLKNQVIIPQQKFKTNFKVNYPSKDLRVYYGTIKIKQSELQLKKSSDFKKLYSIFVKEKFICYMNVLRSKKSSNDYMKQINNKIHENLDIEINIAIFGSFDENGSEINIINPGHINIG